MEVENFLIKMDSRIGSREIWDQFTDFSGDILELNIMTSKQITQERELIKSNR